ncbi:hypothetical protein DCAR_0311945 [Daucus carota subsp. sativus]|uniref:Uncharacterized protein n=1 Tax=Daucus carota subsp. sativus TaxID=79200 RepID=A0A166AST9_DAUCS|nr:hypothetical protein DCAR_0311945 [Daucus carota subsp. sativus]
MATEVNVHGIATQCVSKLGKNAIVTLRWIFLEIKKSNKMKKEFRFILSSCRTSQLLKKDGKSVKIIFNTPNKRWNKQVHSTSAPPGKAHNQDKEHTTK